MTKKTPVYEIETLSREEVGRLLRACSRTAPSGLRDRALLALLYGAGLRIAEALALQPKDLDLDDEAGPSVRVHRGKGGKARTAGIADEGLADILRAWMDKRRQVGAKHSDPVFCLIERGKVGEPIAQANVRQMLARRKKRAGIEKRVHAHGFRHSHATHLHAMGVSLTGIQEQLGHLQPQYTLMYLHNLGIGRSLRDIRARARADSRWVDWIERR